MIENYFRQLEEQIALFQKIVNSSSINKKFYNQFKGYISGLITFFDHSQLHFIEVKDVEIDKKDKYSYHYMNEKKELLFRYDNAFHYTELGTFPNHKHLTDKVISCDEPELLDVLFEISKIID